MEIFLIFFVFAGVLIFAFWFFAIAAIIKSRKNMPSRNARFRQDQTSADGLFLNTSVYPGLSPGQILPPDMGVQSSSIPGSSSGLSGSDAGAMVSTPDLSSVIGVADTGVVSGGDIGGAFGGDAGSGSSSS